jgi:DNA polymerase-3 subunit gamma/tau
LDYQVSARKYRPGAFGDVIGQPHVVQTLVNAIKTRRIAQAFLFSGTRGVGKTTVARILAKALNCEQGPTGTPCNVCPNCVEITQGTSVDVIEIDGASNTSVDDVREIRENVKFTPFRGGYRVYIIDEVHMLSNSAFNALLKTLEEPPPHVVFIFATTEIHKIPPTILSRCQHYNFRRIPRADIIERLRHVAAQDGITMEERSLTALARASEGSMRDALSLLDQAVAFGGKTINHADLEALLGAVPQEHVRAMIEAVIAQDSPAALRVIHNLLDQGHDLRAYCADLVEYARNLLVASVVPSPQDLRGLIEASEEDIRQLASDAKMFTPEQVQELFLILTQAEDALRLSTHPRYVLEVAAVRATRLIGSGTRDAVVPAREKAVPAASVKPETAGKPGPFSHSTRAAKVPSVRSSAPGKPVTMNPSSAVPPAGEPHTATSTAARASTDPARDCGRPPVPVLGSVSADKLSVENEPALSAPVTASASPLRLDWEQFQEEVTNTHPGIASFLERGRFVGIDGNQVTIGFAKGEMVARSFIEREDNLRTITELCQRLAGQPARLRVVELGDTDQPGPTIAEIRAAKEREQRLVLFERARAHPLVKQALEMFGGDLVEVRETSAPETHRASPSREARS